MSLVFVLIVLVEIFSLKVKATEEFSATLVELSVGLTADTVGAVISSAPNFI